MRALFLTALGLTLLTPDFADAQIFGRGGRGGRGGSGWGVGYSDGNFSAGYSSGGWGYGRGYGWGDGYYGGGYGGYGRGYGYGNQGYGWGGSYYGGGYSSPYYGGGYSSTPFYGQSSPGYGGAIYGSPGYMDSNMMGGNVYQAGYGSSMMGNVVRLDIIVPDDNAEVMIQGQKMTGMGRHRAFVSPQLEAGKEYTYTVSIKGTQMREGEDTRKIDVKAGSQYTVDFTRSSNERLPVPGGFEADRPRGDVNRDRDINRDRDNRDRDRDRDNRDPNRPGDTPPARPGSDTPPKSDTPTPPR